VIDAMKYSVVSELKLNVRPRSVAFLPDGSKAYIPSESTGKIHVIDNHGFKLLNTVPLPIGSRPMCVQVTHDGDKLLVSTGRGGMILVLSPVDCTVVNSIKVGARPWGIGISPDDKRLYSANGPSNDVSIVDLETAKELARVKAGNSPWGIAIVKK